MPACSFYTVTDERFFPGAVALLNSLRITGHDQPLVVLDCGLNPEQRRLLGEQATLVQAPEGVLPALAKWYAPQAEPADVMVHVDADAIVVRSLDPLLEQGRQGRVVAFEDPACGRFFPEWQTLLGLSALEPRRYLNAGLVVLPRRPGLELMRKMTTLQEGIDTSLTSWAGGSKPKNPFYYGDQDVMNAVLLADLPGDRVVAVEQRMMCSPDGAGVIRNVRALRRRTLACRLDDGSRAYVLHYWGRRKPWLERVPSTPYTILLSRLLFWDDVSLRLDPRDFPSWLRTGLPASLGYARVYGRRASGTARRIKAKALCELRRGAAKARLTSAGGGG